MQPPKDNVHDLLLYLSQILWNNTLVMQNIFGSLAFYEALDLHKWVTQLKGSQLLLMINIYYLCNAMHHAYAKIRSSPHRIWGFSSIIKYFNKHVFAFGKCWNKIKKVHKNLSYVHRNIYMYISGYVDCCQWCCFGGRALYIKIFNANLCVKGICISIEAYYMFLDWDGVTWLAWSESRSRILLFS